MANKEQSDFQEQLNLAKESKTYVAQVLSGIGFTVKDISKEKDSPFDFLVSSPDFISPPLTLLVDVIRRNYNVPIGVPVSRVKLYDSYSKYDTEDKLIVFHFHRRNRQECMCVSIKYIKEVCFIVGPFYHIEQYQLASTAVLRKKLESRL